MIQQGKGGDVPLADTAEMVHISSLALLKVASIFCLFACHSGFLIDAEARFVN